MTLSGPAMGSRWTARLADPPPGLGPALAAAVERVEAEASLWRPDSDLCRLNAAPVVRCDQPAFVFLGLSMAGWNALASAALAAVWAMSFGAPRARAMR